MNKPTFVTPDTVQHVIDTIVHALQPDQVVVFGSYARNEMQWDSDLDLLVVLDTNLPFVERVLMVRNLFEQIPCPLDIIVYTPQEVAYWRDIPSSFVRRIFSEGWLCYDRTAETVGQTVDSQS